MAALSSFLRLIRPHQWLKNALVFVPVLLAQRFDLATVGMAALAFVAFSLVASSVYVLNDRIDVAADRAHPRKRHRPFASGAIDLNAAPWLAAGLLLAGGLVSAAIGPAFLLVVIGYYLVTLAYSLYLKRQIVIDICTLAGLYAFRLVAGGVASGIQLSVWLLAFSGFLFFALAAVKRQAELAEAVAKGTPEIQGRGYLPSDMPIVAAMALAASYVAVLVLSLYLRTPEIVGHYETPWILWGIPLILFYWLNRIVLLTHRRRMHDDPIVFAMRDPISLLCTAATFVLAAASLQAW